MPKIVVEDYQPAGHGNNKDTNETTNQQKLQNWFNISSNWEKLSEQLTKKLGADKFKNVTLSSPTVTYETISTGRDVRIPKVTFTVAAKDGYNLTKPTGETKQISLSIRVLYTSQNQTENALRYQGVSFSAAPNGANSVNHAQTIKDVNVYLNYTGPSIVLDEALPTVGTTPNTSINGTSNVEGTFNDKFKKLLVNVVRGGHAESSLFQAVINYVNKFDPKFRAVFVTNSRDGVTITKVQS
ncbi:hemagglutinin, partial [Mycoplasmopsis synoviae]